jgi:hypothetical protein
MANSAIERAKKPEWRIVAEARIRGELDSTPGLAMLRPFYTCYLLAAFALSVNAVNKDHGGKCSLARGDVWIAGLGIKLLHPICQ